MVCSKCHQPFPSDSECVKCSSCSAEFHVACCRVRTAAKLKKLTESGTAWRCEECSRETASVSSRSDHEDSAVMELLKSIQRQMAESSRENSSNFTAVQQSISSMQNSIDGVCLKMLALEKENSKLKVECQKMKEANRKMAKDLVTLQYSVSELEQHSKLQNLEVRGIPVTNGEDVKVVLKEVARVLKVECSPRDFSIAHRLPAPRNKRFPPSIIVQFVSRFTRAEWLAAARATRISTTDLSESFTPAPVFINEHLSKHNRELLMRAKSAVKSGSLAYAWTREGKIYVKKTVDSRATRIYCSLEEIFEETPTGGGEDGTPCDATPSASR